MQSLFDMDQTKRIGEGCWTSNGWPDLTIDNMLKVLFSPIFYINQTCRIIVQENAQGDLVKFNYTFTILTF
jgi:hypothetical protein